MYLGDNAWVICHEDLTACNTYIGWVQCMLDKPLILQMNLPVVDIHVTHPLGTKYLLGVKVKIKIFV